MSGKPTHEELEHRISVLEAEIEEHQRIEQELRKNEERYYSLLESSPDAIVVYDMEGRVVYINPAFEETFGWDKKELLGERIDFVPEESREETQAALERMLGGNKVNLFETRRLTKDGKILDVQLSSALFNDQDGWPAGNIVTLRDIGKLKQAERELQRERKLYINGPVATFKWELSDGSSRIIYASPNLSRFGYDPDKFTGGEIDYLEIVNPEDIEGFLAQRTFHCESGDNFFDHEYRLIKSDGEIRWVYDFTIIIRNENDEASYYDSYILDITDRRKAEEAVRENEKRLQEIVRGSSIATFVIDADHRITHYNKACERLTGISASEIIGTRKQWLAFYEQERPVMADIIVSQKDEDEIVRYYGDKYRKSSVVDGGYEAEDFFPALGINGKWVFFTAAPLKDADGNITGAIETLQDVTERKIAEQAILESERRHRQLLDFIPYPIIVMTMEGRVTYLNDAFRTVFGWSLFELQGKTIPFVPDELRSETREQLERFLEEKIIMRYETRRLTKDGRLLDVVLKAAIYPGFNREPPGELFILRDITQEKRMARHNEAILRISLALPYYPELEELMDYIATEVKRLVNTEGALVLLLDERREEFFIAGAAYDDYGFQERAKGLRFKIDQIAAGKVVRTGEPLIVRDLSEEAEPYPERDKKFGYRTHNYILVPLKSSERIIGVLGALNIKEGVFDKTDSELLGMVSGTVALSIENARFSDELKSAYTEVRSLNKAKDKAINHLSHELKTPVSILAGSMKTLEKKMISAGVESFEGTLERMARNLERIAEIQDEVDDIIRNTDYKTRKLASVAVDQFTDLFETLIAEEMGVDHPLIEHIEKRIRDIFGKKTFQNEPVDLARFVEARIPALTLQFSHRQLALDCDLEHGCMIIMPPEYLQKAIDGLIRNAVENTPDEGKIRIMVEGGDYVRLTIKDYGVGIPEEAKNRIFEGFFTTRGTMEYSSKRPFDFNAGGKGADLLRIKTFAERYGFRIIMESERCRYIPRETDICPGKISDCRFCKTPADCAGSGGATFKLIFPVYREQEDG